MEANSWGWVGTWLRKEICTGHAWKVPNGRTRNWIHMCSIFSKQHNWRKTGSGWKGYQVNQESKRAGKNLLGRRMKIRLFRELQRPQSWDSSCGRNHSYVCMTTLTLNRSTSFQWRGRIRPMLLRWMMKQCGTHGSLHVSWRSLGKEARCCLESVSLCPKWKVSMVFGLGRVNGDKKIKEINGVIDKTFFFWNFRRTFPDWFANLPMCEMH